MVEGHGNLPNKNVKNQIPIDNLCIETYFFTYHIIYERHIQVRRYVTNKTINNKGDRNDDKIQKDY